MTRLITASLDEKTYQIWKKIDKKSAWLRRQLHIHGLKNVVMVEHLGHPHVIWGLFKNDARCNPSTQCGTCWSDEQLKLCGKLGNREAVDQMREEYGTYA
jgi:hypothetical protein